ncbi:ATP-dependent DNA helicase chl1 [Desmophyllum pertusum]|uniref:ATP-dependent DNA helicase chl1 n=1 Tax=Desmophyllum pertusum TaxID=174260 RepID=A0A9X0CXE8_9CNID|nr:ATP-dependent DNA helicase chl1 [Desmophyllum pertusum]
MQHRSQKLYGSRAVLKSRFPALGTPAPHYEVEQDGTLVINNVTVKDAGSYSCQATNIMGSASASAPAYVLERTIIFIKPQDKNVKEDVNVDLRCEAKTDKSLELRYYWKRDDATIVYDSKTEWLEGENVLKISDITVEDAGIYTCVAYTPEPKRSEDTASAVVNIQGVPFPPTSLEIQRKHAKIALQH